MSTEPEMISRGGTELAGDLDRDLTLAFQRGEKGAYQAIYDLHSRRVRGVCNRMLPCSEDAQEAAQEVFLRVYQALGRFNGRYQLGPWITRIATNVCLDQIRSKARHPEQLRDDELLELDMSRVPDIDGPEARAMRLAENRRIRRVLASLPPMHRAAIVLRDFEGLSYCEVAVALGITEPQAKALIHRARKSFRRSWTSTLAAFVLPWRHMERARAAVDDTTRDQASHMLVSGSQMAASCSAVFQQCGQYMVERAAGVFTAVVVGSVAAAPMAAAVGSTIADHAAPAQSVAVVSNAPAKAATDSDAARRLANEPEPSAADEEVAQPIPEPEPTAAPQPSATPADGGATEPKPKPASSTSPSPPPAEPAGFTLAFSSDMASTEPPCACLDETRVIQEYVRADEAGVEYFDQELGGTAEAAGTESYGLWLHHSADVNSHTMEFSLRTAEGIYLYSASGRISNTARTEWGGWRVTYQGTYKLGSRPTSSETMPQNGTYRLEISISATTGRVVSAGFSLQETKR